MRPTYTFVCLVLLVLTLVGVAAAVELKGRVRAVNLDEVTLEVAGDFLPLEGDIVQIFTPVKNVGPRPRLGTWKVSRVAQDGVLVIPDISKGARPRVDDTVAIDSPNPQARSEVTATLRTATEAWAQAGASARRSTTQGPVEMADPEAIAENLESAFGAYTGCDYDGALGQLGQAEAIRPGDQRVALLRSLIDRQMQAETLFYAARADSSLDLARQAVEVASPDSTSPPCQMGKQHELVVRLESRVLTELAGEAKKKSRQRYQEQQAQYDILAAGLIGLLGEYSRSSPGDIDSAQAIQASLQELGGALVVAGQGGAGQGPCVVQEHGSESGEAFLVQSPPVAGVSAYHVWKVEDPSAGGTQQMNCATAQECLLKMLPNAAMQILAAFSNPEQAREEAQKRCAQ